MAGHDVRDAVVRPRRTSPGHRRRLEDALRRWHWSTYAGSVAALLQVGFLLELVLPGPLSVTSSQVSELSAPGQPGAWLFRTFDVLTGLLVLAIVPGWWAVRRSVAVALACYGVGLAFAALAPASCADSLQPTCLSSRLPGPALTWQDNVHDVGSIVSVLGLLLGAALAAWALRRPAPARARVIAVCWGVSLVLGAAESLEDVLVVHTGRGVLQRIQIVLLSVVLVALSLRGRTGVTGGSTPTAAPGPTGATPGRERCPSGR